MKHLKHPRAWFSRSMHVRLAALEEASARTTSKEELDIMSLKSRVDYLEMKDLYSTRDKLMKAVLEQHGLIAEHCDAPSKEMCLNSSSLINEHLRLKQAQRDLVELLQHGKKRGWTL